MVGGDSPRRDKQRAREVPSPEACSIETARQIIDEPCAGGDDQRERLASPTGDRAIEAVVSSPTNRDQRRPLLTEQSFGAVFKCLRIQSSVEGVQNRLVVRVEHDRRGPRYRRPRPMRVGNSFKPILHWRRHGEFAAFPTCDRVGRDLDGFGQLLLRESDTLTQRPDVDEGIHGNR